MCQANNPYHRHMPTCALDRTICASCGDTLDINNNSIPRRSRFDWGEPEPAPVYPTGTIAVGQSFTGEKRLYLRTTDARGREGWFIGGGKPTHLSIDELVHAVALETEEQPVTINVATDPTAPRLRFAAEDDFDGLEFEDADFDEVSGGRKKTRVSGIRAILDAQPMNAIVTVLAATGTPLGAMVRTYDGWLTTLTGVGFRADEGFGAVDTRSLDVIH